MLFKNQNWMLDTDTWRVSVGDTELIVILIEVSVPMLIKQMKALPDTIAIEEKGEILYEHIK